MHGIARAGDVVAGRWLVVGVTPRREGRVVHVRDRAWGGCHLSWVPCPEGVAPEAFRARAAAWMELPPCAGRLPCYGGREIAGEAVAVTEYAPGATLGEILAENLLPVEQALRWASRLTAAVAGLHQAGRTVGSIDESSFRQDVRGELRLAPSLVDVEVDGAWELPEGGPPTQPGDVYGLATAVYALLVGFPPYATTARARDMWARRLGARSAVWRRLAVRLLGGGAPHELVEWLARDAAGEQEDVRLTRMLRSHASPVPPTELGVPLPPVVERLLLAALDTVPSRRPPISDLATVLERVAPVPKDAPSERRSSLMVALSRAEQGDGDQARADLAVLARNGSPHARVDQLLLAARERPSRLFELARTFEQEIRTERGWDESLQSFAELLHRRVVRLDGPVRSVSVSSDAKAVAIGGAFSTAARWWEVGRRGGTLPLRGLRRPADEVHVVGDRVLVRSGRSLIMVLTSGAPGWSMPLQAEPVGCVIDRGSVVVGLPGAALWLDAATGGFRGREAVEGLEGLASGAAGLVMWTGSGGVWRIDGSKHPFEQRAHAVAVAEEGIVLALEDHLLFIGMDGTTRPVGPPGRFDHIAAGGTVMAVAKGSTCAAVDLATGDVMATLDMPGDITALSVSPDGSFVVVGDRGGFARTWDPTGDEWPLVIPSADPFATGSTVEREVGERTLGQEDRSTELLLGLLGVTRDWETTCEAPIAAVASDPGSTLLAVGAGRSVHVSRIAGRSVHLDVIVLPCASEVRSVAVSPDGLQIAAGLGEDKPAGTPGGAVRGARILVDERDGVSFSVPIGPDGLTIGRSRDRDLVVADPKVSRRHCTIRWIDGRCVVQDDGSPNGFVLNGGRVWEGVLTPGDQLVLGRATLTYVISNDDTSTHTDPAPPERSQFGVEPPTLMVRPLSLEDRPATPAGRADAAVVWRLHEHATPIVLPSTSGAVRSVLFRSDGMLLTGHGDGSVGLWAADMGRSAGRLDAPPAAGAVSAMALAGVDRWLVAGYAEKVAALWDLESRTIARMFDGHRRPVDAVAISRDARYVATASRDGVVRVWSCRTGEPLSAFVHPTAATSLAFSLDARVLFVGTSEGALYAWSRPSSEILFQVEVASDAISALALATNGRSLRVGARDGSVRVWTLRWIGLGPIEVVGSAEQLFEAPHRPSATWPAERRDLDFWLDMWDDLRGISTGPLSPGLAARVGAVRNRVRVEISRLMPTNGALGSAIGFGALPPRSVDLLGDPFTSVALVDPELAQVLRSARG